MARKVQVILEDDLGDGVADETVVFGIDGRTYEIDLTSENAEALRELLQPYIDNGRRSAGAPKARPRGRTSAADVRQWAHENGIAVSDRGRVSAEVLAQYEEAHA